MKRISKILFVSVLSFFLLTGTAMAVPFTFNDGGVGLQKVINDITVAPISGTSSVDVTNDALADEVDSYWNITASGGSVATMIIEVAGYADSNRFGVFQGNQYVELFEGSSTAGSQTVLSITDTGNVKVNWLDTGVQFNVSSGFGFYLHSPDSLFHSDTALNADGYDHMVAYQGNNIDEIKLPGVLSGIWTPCEYILAFEDLLAPGGDYEFTDFVVMVESVRPVPEPATMLLLGFGLLGLGLARKRS